MIFSSQFVYPTRYHLLNVLFRLMLKGLIRASLLDEALLLLNCKCFSLQKAMRITYHEANTENLYPFKLIKSLR